MDSSANIPNKNGRFHFTIEKDLILIKEVLSGNPFQLGNERWQDVAKNLKEDYGWEVSPRTIKERINNLLMKLQKDDLFCRTGTEEQITERKILLYEIHLLKEESNPDYAGNNLKRFDVREANKDREQLAQERYGGDSPLSETSYRRKRSKISEEEIMLEKQKINQAIEEKKLELLHEEKMKQLEYDQVYRMESLEIEKERLKIEKENKEMINNLLNTLGSIMKQTINKSSD